MRALHHTLPRSGIECASTPELRYPNPVSRSHSLPASPTVNFSSMLWPLLFQLPSMCLSWHLLPTTLRYGFALPITTKCLPEGEPN